MIFFVLLTWPIHDTFGEVGSRASKLAVFGFLRISGGIIDMDGVEDPLATTAFPGLRGGLWNVTADAACRIRNLNNLLLSFDAFSIEIDIIVPVELLLKILPSSLSESSSGVPLYVYIYKYKRQTEALGSETA